MKNEEMNLVYLDLGDNYMMVANDKDLNAQLEHTRNSGERVTVAVAVANQDGYMIATKNNMKKVGKLTRSELFNEFWNMTKDRKRPMDKIF